MIDGAAAGTAILDWYDRHARTLPWRVSPEDRRDGVTADPYRVWLSEIMLQQTTVATVKAYFERFTDRWPDVTALASAPLDEVLKEWAGLGYYARARNLHKCANMVADEHGGRFPDTEAALRALPGIGAYTAAAIASIAFDRSAVVVDGNIERVMARLFAIEDPLPGAKKTLYAAAASLTPAKRPGDHAQALMDLGATICTPRNPACSLCPLMHPCDGRRSGLADTLPRKAPKKAKPTRRGIAYVAVRKDGALLLQRRPETGLLGGMMEVPGSEWIEGETVPDAAPPLSGDWRGVGEARHTFTHFHLILDVRRADVPLETVADQGRWYPRETAMAEALPTLMKKVLGVALDGADQGAMSSKTSLRRKKPGVIGSS